MYCSFEKFIDPAAAAINLTIPAEARASVIVSLQRVEAAAQELMKFPLDSDIEIAQVFIP